MSASSWLEIPFFLVLLAISTPLLGNYMAAIYSNGKAPGDRVFLPIERFCYRACRVDPGSEQRWRTYVMSLLAYTLVSGVLTYAVLRLQAHLPGNPNHFGNVAPGLSFNTAISFMTNTNWQNYAGESTMSELSQMFGLVLHQFISAAVGMALAAAFIRALIRRRQTTLGNFWVDTVRTIVRRSLALPEVSTCCAGGRALRPGQTGSSSGSTCAPLMDSCGPSQPASRPRDGSWESSGGGTPK